MYRYAARRTTRNKKLFLAILIGVIIATTLFATANIGANSLIGAMLTETLDDIGVDMYFDPYYWDGVPNRSTFFEVREEIERFSEVTDTELVIKHNNFSFFDSFKYLLVNGIQHNSTIYNDMTLISGNMSLGANETLIATSSSLISDFPIGSNYSIQVDTWMREGPPMSYNLTLEVVGHVQINNRARNALLLGSDFYFWGIDYESWLSGYVSFFVVDVNSTFLPIYDLAQTTNATDVSLNENVYIYIDRTAQVNPYNIDLSIQNLQLLGSRIQNALQYKYFGRINVEIVTALRNYVAISESFRMTFLQVSLPVFFIALYMGITLNDVSYSIRRREVGLLLTKGVTRSTIVSLFIWESLLVGLVASIISIGVAIFIIPFFIGGVTWVSIFTAGIGLDTIFLTIMFGIILAAFASYLPARKAVKIPTVETIREYTLAGEPVGYSRMLAWTCLVLGGYKLVIWLSGVNTTELALRIFATNPIIGSLSLFWVFFDTLIGFWTPLLFLWGLTTIIIKGWKGFYRYLQRFISRILGELGGLASHNIQRRPGRTVAIIFITALLVGYSIQTTGVLATTQDLAIRDAYATVGADLEVLLSYPENATDLLPIIRNIEGVRNAAEQYTFTINPDELTTMNVRAINVSEWLDVAYLELEWFSGVPAHLAFEALASDNQSIILERVIAVQYAPNIGDVISVQFFSNDSYHPLRIVGFMGPEPIIIQDTFGAFYIAEETWSYVSIELMMNYFSELSPAGHVLVTLESPSDNAEVIQALEALDDVLNVDSAISRIEEYNADILRSSSTNMMQMGVIFSLVLASVGTFVIIYLTLRERRTTTALMSARGMTYSQTTIILMAEILTLMIFAVLIGFVIGIIIYYGLVGSDAGSAIPPLLNPRFLPPLFLGMFALQNGLIISMLILTTIIPILIEARVARYDLSVLR